MLLLNFMSFDLAYHTKTGNERVGGLIDLDLRPKRSIYFLSINTAEGFMGMRNLQIPFPEKSMQIKKAKPSFFPCNVWQLCCVANAMT